MNRNEELAAIATWSPILDDIGELISRVWDRSLAEVGETNEPRMVSVQLFKRLKDHRNAFATLWNTRLWTDAEVILRSAIEVTICIANLNSRQSDFITDLRSDAARTILGQIPIWFESDPSIAKDAAKGLSLMLGDRRSDGQKHSPFRWESLADQAAVPELYRWYKHLSGTSVHVTGLSIFKDSSFVDDPDADDRLASFRRLARAHSMAMMCGAAQIGCRNHSNTLGYSDIEEEAQAMMDRMSTASRVFVHPG